MICPKCRAEYRRGFTVCRDCDVALVESEELTTLNPDGDSKYREPAAVPGDPGADPFCSFWKGTDLRVCTEICTVLDEAGIPHKTIRRQDHLFNLNNQSPYEVGVPASLYEKAELSIKDAFGTDEEIGGENLPLLNEQNRTSFDRLVDQPMQEKLKGRPEEEVPSFLDSLLWKKPGEEGQQDMGFDESGALPTSEKDWYPEDATSLAWCGEPRDAREIIEMSLKENDIWMRWEMQGGKPQLFVLPEDEERAKEIVREVVEGVPPE